MNDGPGMGISGEYAWTAVVLSLIAVVLSAVYAHRVQRAYRMFHDERAAVSLAKALGLLVIAGGLLISALGLLAESASFSIAGMSVARGAFIVLMSTLVLADIRPEGKDGKVTSPTTELTTPEDPA